MSQTVRPSAPRGGHGRRPQGGRQAPARAADPQARPQARPPAPAPDDDEPVVSPGDALEWLWRLFIARKTGLVLILALGLMSLVGTVLEQVPAELRGDPQGYASWLESVRPRYGGWTTVLDRAGAFTTFSSWWFKGTLVALTTSILACSAHRIPQIRRRTRAPGHAAADAAFERAPLSGVLHTRDAAPQALDEVVARLRKDRYRSTVYPPQPGRDDERVLCADRFRWSPFGSVVAHLGFVVVLVGAFLTATTGFKDTGFVAPVGSRVDVGHGTGLTLEATAFTDAYYDDGAPKDYASDLVVSRGSTVVARRTVRVNQPLTVDGVSFYQSFFGTAADLRVADASGRTVSDTAVPLSWQSDDGRHTIGRLTLAAQKVTVYVVMPASGEVDPEILAGQARLEIYPDGAQTPSTTQVLSQGTPQTIDGLTYTFARERRYTGLIVARDPGAWIVWLGALLLVGGTFAVFCFPHRRVWLRVRPHLDGGTTVQAAAQQTRDSAWTEQFRTLVTGLDRALAGAPDVRTDPRTPTETRRK